MEPIRERVHARTPLERRLSARLRQAPAGSCLDFDQFLDLARQGHRIPNYHALMAHIISCPVCRRTYLQTRALIRARRPILTRWLESLLLPRAVVWAPAAVGAVVVLAFLIWRVEDLAGPQQAYRSNGLPATVPLSSPPLLPGDTLREGEKSPRLADTRLKTPPPPNSTPTVSPSERELLIASRYGAFVQEAVELMRGAIAQTATRSAQAKSTPWLRLYLPDIESNYSIEPTQIVFRWEPIADAAGYWMRLVNREDNEELIAVQLGAEQTEFILSEPLKPGEYELEITVLEESERRVFRRRFYVLSPEQQQQLAWARRHATSHPLLSAAVFYKIDRYAEALQSIERAAKKFPNDPSVLRWRALVLRRVGERLADFD